MLVLGPKEPPHDARARQQVKRIAAWAARVLVTCSGRGIVVLSCQTSGEPLVADLALTAVFTVALVAQNLAGVQAANYNVTVAILL